MKFNRNQSNCVGNKIYGQTHRPSSMGSYSVLRPKTHKIAPIWKLGKAREGLVTTNSETEIPRHDKLSTYWRRMVTLQPYRSVTEQKCVPFTASPSTADTSHRASASAGTHSDSRRAQGHYKKEQSGIWTALPTSLAAIRLQRPEDQHKDWCMQNLSAACIHSKTSKCTFARK